MSTIVRRLSRGAVAGLGLAAVFATPTLARDADRARCAPSFAAQVPLGITVKSTELVPAGAKAPEYCRVLASVPSVGNEVEFVVGLPTNWNEKFWWTAQGGLAGSPMDLVSRMSRHHEPDVAMKAGYAVGVTDTGHKGRPNYPGGAARDPAFISNVDRLIDYAYRANHLAADGAKAVIRAYYGAPSKRAIFNACSNGGRAAMINAQRYPGQFDGFVVGAPFISPVRASLDWLLHARDGFIASPAAFPTAEKLKLVGKAVLAACDGLDGAKDGVVSDPRACKFDPHVLQCKGADGPDCLTKAQADAFAAWNSDIGRKAGDFVSHRWLFTGVEGAVSGTSSYQIGPKPAPVDAKGRPLITNDQNGGFSVINAVLGEMVRLDPTYDVRTFDIDTDMGLTAQTEGMLGADDTDLAPAIDKGAKFLFWHGWADPALNPLNTIDYVEAATKRVGPARAASIRLFMMPGLTHCALGEPGSADFFDSNGEIDKWLDGAPAPEQIEAAHYENGKAVRTRPLCAFPRMPVYKGQGDVEAASNWDCRQP